LEFAFHLLKYATPIAIAYYLPHMNLEPENHTKMLIFDAGEPIGQANYGRDSFITSKYEVVVRKQRDDVLDTVFKLLPAWHCFHRLN